MNRKKLTVTILAGIVLAFFALGMVLYQQRVQDSQAQKASQQGDRLVRPHSPVFGKADAPVTLVEFFDPACETCRAFHPIVKDLLRQYPDDLRVVLRYAPFHAGSDQMVLLLEAARLQGRYEALLEMLLSAQAQWADHGNPRLDLAEQLAKGAGLDLNKAKLDVQRPEVLAALRQDAEDLRSLEVTKTPTFFVNGRTLPRFGEEPLRTMVAEAVAKSRQRR